MGLSNSKDPLKKFYPRNKRKNICISQGWIGLFLLEQKENLLQISLVPHRRKLLNFLFQIVKWGNFVETLVYNTLYLLLQVLKSKKTGSGLTVQCNVVTQLIPHILIKNDID